MQRLFLRLDYGDALQICRCHISVARISDRVKENVHIPHNSYEWAQRESPLLSWVRLSSVTIPKPKVETGG